MNTYKGFFKPKNPSKYRGDVKNIVYRSRWELKVMTILDSHTDVLEWGSEEFFIPYRSPVDGKVHRYFPDFYVKKRSPNGKIETIIIEVKPKAQTREPKKQTKVTKKYINEVTTWGVNSAKWLAAEDFCENKGWKFMIMTEDHIGVKW